MSRGLAPSKSTVYISNLPFSLTNNDLHQLLSPYGKVVRITVVKDKENRKSKGVAFALFLDRNEARDCVLKLNNTQLFGRTVKASIARDNGRAAEFIRRREYPNKSRCYECGEFGHLSYKCSKNALGEREPPPKKKKIKKPTRSSGAHVPNEPPSDSDDELAEELETAEAAMDSWSAAVNYQASLSTPTSSASQDDLANRKRRIRKASYFSDEEEIEEEEEEGR